MNLVEDVWEDGDEQVEEEEVRDDDEEHEEDENDPVRFFVGAPAQCVVAVELRVVGAGRGVLRDVERGRGDHTFLVELDEHLPVGHHHNVPNQRTFI